MTDASFVISLRAIQHYLYCPHRFGLIDIDRAFAENYFVVKADLLHERVHSGDHHARHGKKIYTAVKIWHDALGLYGETDCLETDGRSYTIVEYKPTAPKDGVPRHEDVMQVFAQKVCVDKVFGCNCDAYFYYANTKSRVEIPLTENYDGYYAELQTLLREMRAFRAEGRIPPIRKGQYCGGCSMKDLCLPGVTGHRASFREQMRKMLEENA